MPQKRVRLVISGRVQGVWYRASAREQALALGLGGWVRNASGGRVEAAAEGEADAVDAFVAWCRQGPPQARVAGVEATPEEPTGEEPGFYVRS